MRSTPREIVRGEIDTNRVKNDKIDARIRWKWLDWCWERLFERRSTWDEVGNDNIDA